MKYIGGSESFTRQQVDLVVAIKAGNLTGIKPNMNHPSLVFVLPTYLLAQGRSEPTHPPTILNVGRVFRRVVRDDEGTERNILWKFCV